MEDIQEVISGLEYAWEYIRERKNPTAPPKARAMSGIKKAIDLLNLLKQQEERTIKRTDAYPNLLPQPDYLFNFGEDEAWT